MATKEQAIIEVLLSYNDGNSVFSTPRLHNEDPKPAEL
jgi:hypothetical protein